MAERICTKIGWVSENENSSLGYLLFKNGYHDGLTFYDKETYGFDPKIMFTAQIPHDHLPETDETVEYMQSVKKRFFCDSIGDPDVADWLLTAFARALMGEANKMKSVVFCLGASNCGKSTMFTALRNSLGGYGGGFNAHNVAVQKI